MRRPKTDSEVIIDGMMPSAWATYKQSLAASIIGFFRVMFYYSGNSENGGRVERVGVIPRIILELLYIQVSCLKIIFSMLVIAIATPMFLVSPFINLVMLPFYRRKSVKELKVFIDQQSAELAEQRRKVDETLSGAL